MDSREMLDFPNIYNFFIEQKNIYKILPILKREKNSISLSLIDWFVTNYSKKNTIVYTVNKKQFDVYSEYKSQLQDHHKKYFDPFNRSKLIRLVYDNDNYIDTSFRQLNFLRWAIKNKIIKYITDNFDTMINDYKNIKIIRNNDKVEKIILNKKNIVIKFK